MTMEDLIERVSQQDFDIEFFTHMALDHADVRDEVVHQMLTHPHIMVYYHCFYVIENACKENPGLFYEYWQPFAGLLNHPNSYHRNFGLVLISLLAGVDTDHRLDELLPKYLSHVSDRKYLTSIYCVQGCTRMVRARPDLAKGILTRILDQDAASPYTTSQASLLKAEILELIERIYPEMPHDERVKQWITAASSCASPKTRRKAKELMTKYHLLS